jgi:hypothetical protein
MRRPAPILVVTATGAEGRCIASTLGVTECALWCLPEMADTYIGAGLLGGLVIGHSVPSHVARPIVQKYRQLQPFSRVVVLSRPDDITTLTAFGLRGDGAEVFFLPYRAEEVSAYLAMRGPSHVVRQGPG